jgi:hypothetical protein
VSRELRRAAAALAAASVVMAACGDDRASTACDGPFDSARWKHVTAEQRSFDDRYEAERRRMADQLARCRLLVGRSKEEAARLIGRPRDRWGGPYNRETWHFRLGPDSLALDSNLMSVGFSASGEMDRVEFGSD